MGRDQQAARARALHAACQAGSVSDVSALIASGHDAHALDEDGRGLVHVAVAHASMEMVRYLVEEVGLNVLAVDRARESLLHVAVRRGELPLIEYLMSKGVDGAPLVRCPNRSKLGNTSQRLDRCPEDILAVAARYASLEVVEYLMAHGFPLDPSNKHQQALVAIAIGRRDVKMIDVFARSGCDLLATDSTGASMMCLAAKHGGVDVIEYFVNKGLWEDGHLLLRAAVEGDQLDAVKYLGSMRLNLHTRDRESGKNLLWVAVEHASLSMVEYLIEKDLDTHGRAKDGKTLLHTAFERGEVEIINYIAVRTVDFEQIVKDEVSALSATRSGDVKSVSFVLDNGGLLNAVDKNGYSLAHFAVWRDSLPLLDLFETRGLVLQDSDSLEKPLMRLAVAHASIEVIRYLVDKGISILDSDKAGVAYLVLDPSQNDLPEDEYVAVALGGVAAPNLDGKFSVLHAAVQRGDKDVIQYLLEEGVDVRAVDKMGRTILHLAAQANIHTVEYVLEQGIDINAVDKRGYSALHYAVQAGKQMVIETLVTKGGGLRGQRPTAPSLLELAVKQRDIEVVRYLFGRGLPLDMTLEGNKSLLHVAVHSGCSKEMVDFLLDNGVKWDAPGRHAKSTPPLHVAIANQDVILLEHLINRGFDVHELDDGGNNLLHAALRQHIPPFAVNLKLLAYLCEKKVDVNAPGKRGVTPLHIACRTGDQDSAKFLIQHGAADSLVVQNEDGLLPVHVAARRWDPIILKILLEAGADVGATSKLKVTPLGSALSSSRLPLDRTSVQQLYSTARTLCKYGASWTTDCEESLATWPQQMHTWLEKQSSKDSTWSSGKESDLGSFLSNELDPLDQQELLERDLDEALGVKKGIRACVAVWSCEKRKEDTRLTHIPTQVIARGEEIVSAYLSALRSTDVSQLLYRRKICVAGPTKWGKTSLIKSVTSSRSQLVPEGDRTVGIELFSCSFIEERDDAVKCHDVTFWDFAGQDGYQVVHSVFFSRQTLYLVCVDLEVYSKSLASGGKEAHSMRQAEAELSRFVGRSVFSWIRLIFARQPDSEMIIVGTKADMLKDTKELEEVKQDLQVRLSTWKRRLQKEIDDASAVNRSPQPTRGFGDSLQSAKLAEKLKLQVTKLLTSDWLVVSTVDEDAVEQAWNAIAERITASDRCFVMPAMYSRVLRAIRAKQAVAAKLLNGKDRVESTAIPIHALCKILMREIDDLDSDQCLHILHSLHDMGDVLWFEDAHVGPLQDIVILDPLLVIDLVREVINHEQMGGRGVVASDGRVSHELLMKCHLWKDMDSELVYAFKLLLQYYQVAYPLNNSSMDWDSDLIVPSYWKAQEHPVHPQPLLQQNSSIQRRGVQASVFLCWDYDLSAEVSETLFEQFAVESHTPLFERQAWRNCIESFTQGEFASYVELSPGRLNFDVIRIEVAAEDQTIAWRYMRFYVMAMETVLDRYPGLLVSRHIVVTQGNQEQRHRVNLAARSVEDAVRMDQDGESLRASMPWIPADFSWFVERAWKDPGILQRLRTRELVRQGVDKLDVLRRLVTAGDKRRRYPALWSLDYDDAEKKITLKMMSDLSGICFHVPIEIGVPPAFIAEYGSWIQHGLSICSNVVPKLLSLPILQKVFEAAQPLLATHVDRAQRVHNLIDSIDLSAAGTFEAADRKLPPGVAMLMLEQLLKLHDDSFDELKIAQVTNLECAATTGEGFYVWAHRHEILELKGKLELCDPEPEPVSSLKPSAGLLPPKITLRLAITATRGLAPWDWRQAFCAWQLYYGENTTPLASGQTSQHRGTTSEPTWSDATFDLTSVASIEMLRECRLVVQVKRPSRFLDTTKTLHEGSVWLRDFLAKDAAVSFQCDPIKVPFEPSTRYAACELTSV